MSGYDYSFSWDVEGVSLKLYQVNLNGFYGSRGVTIDKAPGPGNYQYGQLNGAGYPVTKIAVGVYGNDNWIQYVTMNNVTGMDNAYQPGVFNNASQLLAVSFPNCTNIPYACFQNCQQLQSVNMPLVTVIDQSAFEMQSFRVNSNLTSLSFPKLTTFTATLGGDLYTFRNLVALNNINLGVLSSAASSGSIIFYGCSALSSIYFLGNQPVGLSGSFVTSGTPTIYVSKTATGWGSTYQSFPVVKIDVITAVTPPTTSVSSTGGVVLTNTQNATTYQWRRNGVAISGATSASYTLVPATDLNQSITLSASDSLGNSATSAASILTKYAYGPDYISYKFAY